MPDQDYANTVVRIPIYSEGWTTPWTEVIAFLDNFDPDPKYHTVTFDIREGVGIEESGILAMIQRWQRRTGYPDHKIKIQSRNTMEHLPYQNLRQGVNMHFFNEARAYNLTLPVAPNAQRLAMFIGRLTLPRLCMMHDITHDYYDACLLSHLQQPPDLPMTFDLQWPDWAPYTRDDVAWHQNYNVEQVYAWYRSTPPSSIDNACTDDQYRSHSHSDFNRLHGALIQHYNKFGVELVVETMLYGNTFWPTEKIARPLAAAKPFVVMASPGFVQRLRCLGFQTFEHLWDESYDNLQGLARWQAIKKVVDFLATLSDRDFEHIQTQARSIAEHNHQVLLNKFPIYHWTNLEPTLKNVYQTQQARKP